MQIPIDEIDLLGLASVIILALVILIIWRSSRRLKRILDSRNSFARCMAEVRTRKLTPDETYLAVKKCVEDNIKRVRSS
jgi:HAMP domain-containing protein